MNYCDHTGATRIKERIEAYWRERGYEVSVVLVQGQYSNILRETRMDLRSDMVNGLPRGWREPLKERLEDIPPDPPYAEHDRPCISCGRSFLSTHRFHRLCDLCRAGPRVRSDRES